MRQRLRCPECHHWSDALLVWAAGDCCPQCNAPIVASPRELEESERERTARPLERLSQSRPRRLSHRP
jgi:hypothetical protein